MAWAASWLCPFHCPFIRDGIEIFKKRYHAEKNFGHFSWEKGTILQAFDFGNDVCEVWEVCIQFCTFSRMFKHIAFTHEIRFQCCKTFFLQAWKPDWNRRVFGQLGEKIFVSTLDFLAIFLKMPLIATQRGFSSLLPISVIAAFTLALLKSVSTQSIRLFLIAFVGKTLLSKQSVPFTNLSPVLSILMSSEILPVVLTSHIDSITHVDFNVIKIFLMFTFGQLSWTFGAAKSNLWVILDRVQIYIWNAILKGWISICRIEPLWLRFNEFFAETNESKDLPELPVPNSVAKYSLARSTETKCTFSVDFLMGAAVHLIKPTSVPEKYLTCSQLPVVSI